MQCYTDLIGPTAVTHSLSLPFLSATANNLIITKTSLLQIFSLKSILTDANEEAKVQENGPHPHEPQLRHDSSMRTLNRKAQRGERSHTSKLVLVAQYELSGTVTALGRVKSTQSKSGGDTLLVALKDAKLSLVEWDPERHNISTVSIHYYEREDLQGPPWSPEPGQCLNYLAIDPNSRCAALRFGARNIAILPFHQANDDLVMDDYDPSIDINQPKPLISPSRMTNGDSHSTATPYAPSFVLSLLMLDPSLIHPVHLAFLYEFREPTFGVLSSRISISSALLSLRQDPLSYTVYTLDLDQRASTTLLSVTGLPYDLHTILPLPSPVGGALLVGFNELVHVDQAGKTNGLAVNEFGRQCSSFALPLQQGLALRLEGCVIEQLGTPKGEMLLIMNTGELAILNFKRDGRSVSGLSIRQISVRDGGFVLCSTPSCTSSVGRGRIFVGSEHGDSVILGWSRKLGKLKKQKSGLKIGVDEGVLSDLEEDDDIEDEDDLYAATKPEEASRVTMPWLEAAGEADEYAFRIHDTIMNLAPLGDLAFVGSHTTTYSDIESSQSTNLMVATGRGQAGGISKISSRLEPIIRNQQGLPEIWSLWALDAAKAISDDGDVRSNSAEGDNALVVSTVNNLGDEMSSVYRVASGIMEEIQQSEFDPSGGTIDVGIFNEGSRVIQVLKNEIRVYDGDFGLAQIFAMSEENIESDPTVVHVSFAEPYILLVRDDSGAVVVKAEESGDLEEIERGDSLLHTKWLCGSLFEDSNDVFRLESEDEEQDEGGNVLMFLVDIQGGLKIYKFPNLNTPIYTADGLSFLPPFLSSDFTVRRSAAREELTDILIAELGDIAAKAPYMILRSADDNITIYQPFQCPVPGNSGTILRFLKVPNSCMSHASSGELTNGDHPKRKLRFRAVQDINGYSTVFIPGSSPSLLLKSASSLPHIIELKSRGIRSLSGFNSRNCRQGFIYADNEGNVSTAQLSRKDDYSTGWVVQKMYYGEEVQAFDYHEKTDRYVLGTSQKVDFKLPEDELHNDWAAESQLFTQDEIDVVIDEYLTATSFLPQVDQGSVKVLDPSTWSITDTYDLDPVEVVTCIKTMHLETSEIIPSRRSLVAIGTALLRGEDLPSIGRIYIFDIIDVVPEPDYPETGLKLKLIAKEETKGAVTAISEIGTEGFLLVAQGQKCMVRGLKEDGSLLPVSFMDMQCYVTVAKELGGTGLCLMGDAIKGVWFAGYSEDPYQLRLFSKSTQHIEVLAADFLPYADQLFLVAHDASCNLHVFQFDPDRLLPPLPLLPPYLFADFQPSLKTHSIFKADLSPLTHTDPKSLSGQRLLQNTIFSTGLPPSTATLLLPSSSSSTQNLLLTSSTGAISLLSPLPPSTYRTLSALQSFLFSTLQHPLSLNPRSYRQQSETVVDGMGRGGGGRGVLDGNILMRWRELGSWKRREGEGRCGVEREGEVEWIISSLREGAGF